MYMQHSQIRLVNLDTISVTNDFLIEDYLGKIILTNVIVYVVGILYI